MAAVPGITLDGYVRLADDLFRLWFHSNGSHTLYFEQLQGILLRRLLQEPWVLDPAMHCLELVWCLSVFTDLAGAAWVASPRDAEEACDMIKLRAVAEVADAEDSPAMLLLPGSGYGYGHHYHHRGVRVAALSQGPRTAFAARMVLSGKQGDSHTHTPFEAVLHYLRTYWYAPSCLATCVHHVLREAVCRPWDHASHVQVEALFDELVGLEESPSQAVALLMLQDMIRDDYPAMLLGDAQLAPLSHGGTIAQAVLGWGGWEACKGLYDNLEPFVPTLLVLEMDCGQRKDLADGLKEGMDAQLFVEEEEFRYEAEVVQRVVAAIRRQEGGSDFFGSATGVEVENLMGLCREMGAQVQRHRRLHGRLAMLRFLVGAWPGMLRLPRIYAQLCREKGREWVHPCYAHLWAWWEWTIVRGPGERSTDRPAFA